MPMGSMNMSHAPSMPSMIGSMNMGSMDKVSPIQALVPNARMLPSQPMIPNIGSMPGSRLATMLPSNPFVKAPQSYDPCYRPPGQMRTMNYTAMDKYCADKARAEREASKPFMPRAYDPSQDRMAQLKQALGSLKRPEPNNTAVRPSAGDPTRGFQVNLPHVVAPLPTAPAVVGGNVDWTSLKSNPATQFLHSQLSLGRPMMPPPALGSAIRLTEPSVNSIHTTY